MAQSVTFFVASALLLLLSFHSLHTANAADVDAAAPLVEWTGSAEHASAFGDDVAEYAAASVDEQALATRLTSLFEADSIEAAVVYLFDELSTLDLSLYTNAYAASDAAAAPLSGVRSAIEAAAARAEFPFVQVGSADAVVVSAVRAFLAAHAEAKVVLVRDAASARLAALEGEARVQVVATDALADTVADPAVHAFPLDVFANGGADLVLVCLDVVSAAVCPAAEDNQQRADAFAATGAYIHAFDQVVSERTSQNYVAALTADRSGAMCTVDLTFRAFEDDYEAATFAAATPAPTAGGDTYTSYFPSGVLTTYLVSSVLIIIALVGAIATFNQQTPESLTMYKPKRSGVEQSLLH